MEEKLRKLMKHEGINSMRLAEILGIQASGISHIMSGRNKPSYDFILKLLQRFPQINPDWLFLDKGPMYRDGIKSKNSYSSIPNIIETRSTAVAYGDSSSNDDLFSDSMQNEMMEHDNEAIISDNHVVSPVSQIHFPPSSPVERIVVFYKDKTFSEYHPE